jgi:hypothetical protein
MVRKPSSPPEIEALIQQAQAARDRLSGQAAVLRQQLDIPARIRSSLSGHPGSWMAGSLVSGLAASLLFRRKRKPAPVQKPKGTLFAVLGLILTALRPLAKVWLANQAERWLTQNLPKNASARPQTRPFSGSNPL